MSSGRFPILRANRDCQSNALASNDHTIVGMIIDDIFQKIIDLSSVFSSRFGLG